jgi:hypothetical protein
LRVFRNPFLGRLPWRLTDTTIQNEDQPDDNRNDKQRDRSAMPNETQEQHNSGSRNDNSRDWPKPRPLLRHGKIDCDSPGDTTHGNTAQQQRLPQPFAGCPGCEVDITDDNVQHPQSESAAYRDGNGDGE